MNVAAVILNGGQSRRMGKNKSGLKLQGQTLLERVKQLLKSAGVVSVYVSGPDGIPDEFIDAGPLSGIFSSLNQLKAHEYVLFIPVDMPLVDVDMIQSLCHQLEADLVHFAGANFPLLVHNNSRLRGHLLQQLESGKLAIHQLIKSVNSLSIFHEWSKDKFFNANSPQEWQRIRVIIDNSPL